MRPIRVALALDFPEEGWTSMDFTGAMILEYLRPHELAGTVEVVRACPRYRTILGRVTGAGGRLGKVARNFDRVFNRFVNYPGHLRRLVRRDRIDVVHVVDHSYAHLALAAPRGRALVTCYDLDAFRSLIDPAADPRPAWYRALARRTLRGLRSAGAVLATSRATRDEILDHRLVPLDRLELGHLGIGPEYFATPDPRSEAEADRLLRSGGGLDLLHVGSNIPRKRIDLLLEVFAGVRRLRPEARLLKVGGRFEIRQWDQARALGVDDAVVFLPFLDRATLAAIYRRVALVLLPSEAEGFGLPLAEAMACRAPILASDLAVFREVAGDAATYRAVGDVPGWVEAAAALVDAHRRLDPEATRRLDLGGQRAQTYRWDIHLDRTVTIYQNLMNRPI